MKTSQKIGTNLINNNIFPSLSQERVIFENNQFMSKQTLHRINPSILFQFDMLHLFILQMGMI